MREYEVTFEGYLTVEADSDEDAVLRQAVQSAVGFTGVIVGDILDSEAQDGA